MNTIPFINSVHSSIGVSRDMTFQFNLGIAQNTKSELSGGPNHPSLCSE